MHSSFAHIGSGKEEEMGCVSITISVTFFLLKSEANMAKCESSVTYSGWWVHGSLSVCFPVLFGTVAGMQEGGPDSGSTRTVPAHARQPPQRNDEDSSPSP